MTIRRWAQRRDKNDRELAEFATLLGWRLTFIERPVDYLGLLVKSWRPIEIKTKSGTLTQGQKDFISETKARGGEVLIWRNEQDVMADTLRIRGY